MHGVFEHHHLASKTHWCLSWTSILTPIKRRLMIASIKWSKEGFYKNLHNFTKRYEQMNFWLTAILKHLLKHTHSPPVGLMQCIGINAFLPYLRLQDKVSAMGDRLLNESIERFKNGDLEYSKYQRRCFTKCIIEPFKINKQMVHKLSIKWYLIYDSFTQINRHPNPYVHRLWALG